MTTYYFVVDTESYAGNFEREMCAFMTGQVGECGVGQKAAAIFEEDCGEDLLEEMEDLIGAENDDRGCCRPAKIYPTPGWFNNGVGGHYKENDPGVMKRAQEEHDVEVQRYADNTIRKVYADQDYADKEADEHIKEGVGRPITKHPAYMSVAICLNREPTAEEIIFLKGRAKIFGASHMGYNDKPAPIAITSFRLVVEQTVADAKTI